MIQFNEELAPLAYALFYRSYGRYHNGQRETIEDVLEGRTIEGLKTLGNLTPEEVALITKYQQQLKVFTSGRGLFVQGTPAATKPENVYSHYNCSNINIEEWSDFGLLMNLAMQGTGTGAKLEPQHINKLPPIRNKLIVEVKDEIGSIPANQRIEESKLNVIYKQEGIVLIELHVGDSRKGWVQAYQSILELSSADSITPLSNLPNVHFFRDESNYPTSISKLDLPLELSIHIYLANVRPKNEPLKGFGGVSNPSALPPLFSKCAAVLNKAIGRQLNSVECCKLIDEAATTIVAGNIRRCLPLGTGIQTDWGITPIEDIGIGDRVLTTSGLKKVTDIFHQGQQPLVKITTSDRCLYCSPNHKIAIPDEFITDSFHKLTKSNGKRYSMIPAIDLTIGQAIQISLMDEDEGDPYFLFGQFGNELQEALELEFFDPIESNKPIEGLIPCYSFLKSKLQSLLLENGYEYTTSQIMIGDYSRVSILIQDYERLNREPEVLQKIEDIYSTLIGNSYIYSSITHIDYDTGIERATFDIEVEEAHEFYAEGILVSNSAGMRQGASDDKEFAVAKDNLWLQDSQGNWKIDLERDALRMSNHTRVFKHKPTYEECLAAVTKQYYSGEGAIQWAGEAVARSNADLLVSKELKKEFLDKYASSQQEAIDFLYTLNPYMDEREVQHRLGRWGLNPCYAAGTMVLTRKGSYPIESLIGKIVDIWDGENWVTIDNFRVTGENQEVWKLTLSNGEDLIATPYHIFILKDGTRLPLKELEVGMELLGMMNNYSIVSITYSHIADKVYCCTVPTTNTFALSNGVLTGNCGEIIGEDFLCVSGDTLLITKDGLHKIKDLVGEEVEIWNGKQWSKVSPFKTGSNRILYRVKFRDGSYLDTTENHRFFVKDRFNKNYKEVQTKDLMSVSKYAIHTEPFKIKYEDGLYINPEYAYSLGVAVGDGTIQSNGKPIVRLYDKKTELEIAGTNSPIRSYSPESKDITHLDFSGELITALKHNPDSLNVIASWNKEAILFFMAGLADTDGSNTDSNGIRIYISDYERAYRCQLLLTKCGIRSSVNLCAEKGAVTNKGTRSKDLYYLQITDCGQLPCQRLDVSKGCNARFKGKWQTIESVVQLAGTQDTYCFTEPEFHKGVFGNTLTGNCNLSDIQLNLFDALDLIAQREAFRTGGLMVAILLNHKFPDEITQYSREIDPIVGVSFNGLFDFFVNALGIEWLRWWQSDRDKNYQGELQPEFKSVAEVLNIDVNNYQEGDTYKLGQLFYDIEKAYLSMWKQEVFNGVYEYCDARGLKRPNRTTCVQPGGCGDRSLIRVTDQGLIYMDEIMEDGAGDISGLELSVRNGILVNKGIANEPSNLVKIVLNNGRILRLTADHRLAVNDNWLSVEELIPGMSLDYKLDTYDSKKNYPLVKIDFSSYTKYNPNLSIGEYKKGYITPISLPDTLSPDLAYLIGAMYGNGCCDSRNGTGRVRFTHEKVEVLNKIQDISEKVFGFRGSVSSSCTKKLELILSSTLLYDWLNLNQLIKKEKDLERIPFPVRCSSKETILGFFCGLIDTDGCIRRGGTLSIDSASEAFIRNLQQIGEAIGLSFSVFHNNKGKNLQGQKDMWGLCFSRMLSTPEAIQYINEHSVKAQTRPIPLPKKQFNFNPYQIAAIEYETTPDYSFDITVEGKDDDDSWYWQGALKSHNSKSLLTGASSGWHPPKAAWFIRRMTFRREDPIALAALDYGYTIVPSQSCKDEEGNLLNDPFDPRVDEWLLEVPVQVAWADIPGVEDIDISQLSAEAQWDFYMNVQEHYTTHNCFSRDTSFLTPQGLKTFYDFEVNDKVIVLNADGDWSEAIIIKTNDVRPMLELSLVEETTNSVMTITCTYCHRFPIGSLILTAKELQVGMTLSLNPLALQDCSWTIENIREAEPQEGWCVMEPITHHFTLSNNILVMNSSGTIEFQEHEISIMASNIFHSIQNDEGYISVALLQRLTSYFPRLPMEPISKTTYIELRKEVLSRRKSPDFHSLLQHYTQLSGLKYSNPQDSACEGLICELRSFSQ